MKITFLGAIRTVTGSKYLLEVDGKRILIDCGLFQGLKELRLRNWTAFPIPPRTIDAVILTHAHLDHSGYLPLLVRQGFRGPIYATRATRDLCELLLRDAGRIQEEDAFRARKHGYSKHKKPLPLFTEEEAINALSYFHTIPFEKEISIGKHIKFTATPSGHILGSAFITLKANGKTVVFTGDLGRPNDLIMKPPAKIREADYLILESTYGNRPHSVNDPENELGEIIRKTVKRKGTVLIPAFAVGRTQTVLYLLSKLKEKGAIPAIPIFLDSPMAQDATDILQKNCGEHRMGKEECRTFCKVAKYIQSVDESKALNELKEPCVILSASGMLEGGRVLHHLKHFGPDPKNSLVFTGYQAVGTRGARILQGEPAVKIHGSFVPIRCQIEQIKSLSSHVDTEEAIQWLKGMQEAPKTVFLTHGEFEASQAEKKIIEEKLGWHVVIPDYLEQVNL